jgi:hypothetical protein
VFLVLAAQVGAVALLERVGRWASRVQVVLQDRRGQAVRVAFRAARGHLEAVGCLVEADQQELLARRDCLVQVDRVVPWVKAERVERQVLLAAQAASASPEAQELAALRVRPARVVPRDRAGRAGRLAQVAKLAHRARLALVEAVARQVRLAALVH